MLPDDFQHPTFIKSEREVIIDRMCQAVRQAKTTDEERAAAQELIAYIEGR